MKPEELGNISVRLARYWETGEYPEQIAYDAESLLTEVERLQAEVIYLRQSSCQGGRDFGRPRPVKPGDPTEDID